MKNLDKRLEKLEATNKPEVPLEWTEEEKRFRDDVHSRMKVIGTKHFCDVCTHEELNRMQKQSTKASLIWFRNNHKNISQ